MLTALILLSIIALWAAVFLFGLRRGVRADPPTKTAPASFFVATDIAPAAYTGATGEPVPTGMMPKDGSMTSGLGGTIAGTVTATSSGEPVGRIQVDALRPTPDGGLVLAASSATQADGSYQVAGLFPASYLLRFSATGFDPMSTTRRCRSGRRGPGARRIRLGHPGDQRGHHRSAGIDHRRGRPGGHPARRHHDHRAGPPRARTPARTSPPPPPTATTPTNCPDLPAPAVYELSFAAAGLPAVGGANHRGRRLAADPADAAAHRRSRADLRGRHRRHRPVGRRHRHHHRRRQDGDHRHPDHRRRRPVRPRRPADARHLRADRQRCRLRRHHRRGRSRPPVSGATTWPFPCRPGPVSSAGCWSVPTAPASAARRSPSAA